MSSIYRDAVRGPRIFTYTRREINPLDIRLRDVDILDIAHGLALQNRFVGQSDFPLNLAQHCVYVYRLCGTLQALLHDASEAYIGDMTKWVKQADVMAGYRAAEKQLQERIYCAFSLDSYEPDLLKDSDALMVRYEAARGFDGDFRFDQPVYDLPFTMEEIIQVGEWHPWTWQQAEYEFLKSYHECHAGMDFHTLLNMPRGPYGVSALESKAERGETWAARWANRPDPAGTLHYSPPAEPLAPLGPGVVG